MFEKCMPTRDKLDNIEQKCSGWSLFNICDTASWLIKSIVNATLGMKGTVSQHTTNSV